MVVVLVTEMLPVLTQRWLSWLQRCCQSSHRGGCLGYRDAASPHTAAVVLVTEMPVALVCGQCQFVATDDADLESHILRHQGDATPPPPTAPSTPTGPRPTDVLCPLCQERCAARSGIEGHLIRVHSVSEKGLQRLMAFVEAVEVPAGPAAGGAGPTGGNKVGPEGSTDGETARTTDDGERGLGSSFSPRLLCV